VGSEEGTGAACWASAFWGGAFNEALSNLFSSSWTMTALAGIGGIPEMDSPGGGLAGETDVAVVALVVVVEGGTAEGPFSCGAGGAAGTEVEGGA